MNDVSARGSAARLPPWSVRLLAFAFAFPSPFPGPVRLVPSTLTSHLLPGCKKRRLLVEGEKIRPYTHARIVAELRRLPSPSISNSSPPGTRRGDSARHHTPGLTTYTYQWRLLSAFVSFCYLIRLFLEEHCPASLWDISLAISSPAG